MLIKFDIQCRKYAHIRHLPGSDASYIPFISSGDETIIRKYCKNVQYSREDMEEVCFAIMSKCCFDAAVQIIKSYFINRDI